MKQQFVYLIINQKLDYDDYPIGGINILSAHLTKISAEEHCPTTIIDSVTYPRRGYFIQDIELL